MNIFGKKKEEDTSELEASIVKKLKDLKPEHKRARKEPPKPWGKKERYFILVLLSATFLVSLFLSLSSTNYKISNLSKLNFSIFNFKNIFKGETVVVGKKEDVEKALRDKKAEEIKNEFKNMTQSVSGKYAFEVIDLSSGYKFGVNENNVMQAASLIKLPLMLYALGKVNDSKIEAMGKRSDNNVFRELINQFGKKAVQDYIESLGMPNTSIERNETTPDEVGNFFLRIYKEGNEKLLGYMTDTIFEKWIKEGVPHGIRVAHKYGREIGVVNDAGVIYSKHPFVLVIMTNGVDVENADLLIPQLVNMIYSKYEIFE